jgi:hypothetical protein
MGRFEEIHTRPKGQVFIFACVISLQVNNMTGHRDEIDLIYQESCTVRAEIGKERRCEERKEVRKPGRIRHINGESPIPVLVVDISSSGIMVEYSGAVSFDWPAILYVDEDDLDLHTPAEVIWSIASNNGVNRAGLRHIWHLKQ